LSFLPDAQTRDDNHFPSSKVFLLFQNLQENFIPRSLCLPRCPQKASSNETIALNQRKQAVSIGIK